MLGRLFFALLVALVAYGIYCYIQLKQDNFINYGLHDESFEYPSRPQPIAPLPPRTVTSSGPAAPNQRAKGVRFASPEQPYDPADASYESSDIPERLRHPETMFGPGVYPDAKATATLIEDSGVGSAAQQQTARSFSTFSPEFAQNGGVFMDGGITAYDSDIPNQYSELD
jgi:hypothetical protein